MAGRRICLACWRSLEELIHAGYLGISTHLEGKPVSQDLAISAVFPTICPEVYGTRASVKAVALPDKRNETEARVQTVFGIPGQFLAKNLLFIEQTEDNERNQENERWQGEI